MGRYSLNLRDKYGRNELTGGERISQGIGDALQFYMQESDARRAERNDIARQGGVAVGTPPTGMDRLRGIGGALRRTLRRTPDFNGDITQTGALTDTSNERDGVEPSFVPASVEGGRITPPSMFAPPPISSSLAGSPSFVARQPMPSRPAMSEQPPMQRIEDLQSEVPYSEMRSGLAAALARNGGRYADDSQDSGHGMMEPPPRSMEAIATQPPPAANGAPQPSSNISSAIAKTIYEGRNGQKYEIDPSRQARMQAGIEDEIAQGREARTTAAKEAEIQRTVDAAVRAGMPRAEAETRARTNTFRYDETFGQQRTNGGMTQAERLEIEKIRTARAQEANALRLKIAGLAAAGRQNSEEYRQAMLALATADLALKTADARADNFDRVANAAEGTVPTNPIDRRIATAGGDSARIASAESTAAANRDSAGRIRTQGAATAESIARGVAPRDGTRIPTPTFTPEQTRARAVALQTAGKSKQETYEIMKAEGYNVAPPRP